MHDCEEFLKTIQRDGFDISSISLKTDSVDQSYIYRNDSDEECHSACRSLEITAKFDMKMINSIRSIVNGMNTQIGFDVQYELSSEHKLRETLLKEALLDARWQADLMAQAVDQKVVGLVSANKDTPKRETDSLFGLCSCLCSGEVSSYSNSDKLSASKTTISEFIYTTWEIA